MSCGLYLTGRLMSFLEVCVRYLKDGLSNSCLAHLPPPYPHRHMSPLFPFMQHMGPCQKQEDADTFPTSRTESQNKTFFLYKLLCLEYLFIAAENKLLHVTFGLESHFNEKIQTHKQVWHHMVGSYISSIQHVSPYVRADWRRQGSWNSYGSIPGPSISREHVEGILFPEKH